LRRFNFHVQIDSKVKRLKKKNPHRLVNQLRYAKTICDQKIAIQKRNSAALLSVLPLDASEIDAIDVGDEVEVVGHQAVIVTGGASGTPNLSDLATPLSSLSFDLSYSSEMEKTPVVGMALFCVP